MEPNVDELTKLAGSPMLKKSRHKSTGGDGLQCSGASTDSRNMLTNSRHMLTNSRQSTDGDGARPNILTDSRHKSTGRDGVQRAGTPANRESNVNKLT